ncbi:MAG: alcohol dehydrogenase, partial [Defluviitaleaceae bacterium]|nr:alcohol dehydrogenase [Defluviitaleaceae bacterium]
DKELSIIGTLMYVKEDWLETIGFAANKKVRLDKLISSRFPLVKLAEAFKFIEENKSTVMKVLIEN